MSKISEKLMIGLWKSIIPMLSIVGMIQYSVTKPLYAYIFAFTFVCGYMINELFWRDA